MLYKVIEESDGNIDSENLKSALTIFKSIVGEEFDPVTRREKESNIKILVSIIDISIFNYT